MPEGELQRRLGTNLRRIRDQRGLSQEDFALELGFHRTYMSGLERGVRNVSLKSLERIAVTIGCDPVELISEA